MNRKTKLAASANAASSMNGALSWTATHPEYGRIARERQERGASLRLLADLASMAASEALNRDSAERLHAATACIFDALAFERRAFRCGRAAP